MVPSRLLAFPLLASIGLAVILTGSGLQGTGPVVEAAPASDKLSSAPIASLEDCPVTPPVDPPFVPPPPWPATPPDDDEFWVGTPGLWTALPNSGSWRQLAIGEKFWWWSENYAANDVLKDGTPDLSVTSRLLGAESVSFHSSEATNGFHESFDQAMLIGVRLPEAGCWEFNAEFQSHTLSVVVWVPGK